MFRVAPPRTHLIASVVGPHQTYSSSSLSSGASVGLENSTRYPSGSVSHRRTFPRLNFMAAILLGMTGLDPFDANAQPEPPDGEFAEVEQGMGRSEGHAVIAGDVARQAALLEKPLKYSESILGWRREPRKSACQGGPELEAVPHMPFVRKALEARVKKKVASEQPLPDYESEKRTASNLIKVCACLLGAAGQSYFVFRS